MLPHYLILKKETILILRNLSYIHPDKDPLFGDINLTVNKQDKIALVGNNGAGKSTLLRILAGELPPSSGILKADERPYYMPQVFGRFNHMSVAQALKVQHKLEALKAITAGNVTVQNMNLLDDDWSVQERCHEALQYWGLNDVDIERPMSTLSGGQKTKVFLAGIFIHQPGLILLDEPSNHLDTATRERLYDFIKSTTGTLIAVSHDRKLLNMLSYVYELSKQGITVYGGNYDFYAAQKANENNALFTEVRNTEKALRKAKEKQRETMEKQRKLDARGKKKQEKAGLPTVSMNTLRNNAEKSTARLKNVHAEKINMIVQELHDLRQELPGVDKMKLEFDDSALHAGKILFNGSSINFSYENSLLWKDDLNLQVRAGERIAVKGSNGSGKTTLIKIILGVLEPVTGKVHRTDNTWVYLDQDYSLINDALTVYEQAQQFNAFALQEHEVKSRLNRFLFTRSYWDKYCATLSGGEKMRLILCCLNISTHAPDIIVLDEPTNNLDIQNMDILTTAINDYKGTILIVSHDEYFLKQAGITGTIVL